MQLRIQRSQRAGGVIGNTVFFCLDVRADYSAEEGGNIRKYRLGSEVIYNSLASRRHLESAGKHLERTQAGGAGERAAGLARGVFSLAMAKMRLNISIASLGRGHHIECKSLEELLEAEDTVRTACKDVTRWLQAAATFDGSEIVIDYENGEEKIHVAQDVVPLLGYTPAPSGEDFSALDDVPPSQEANELAAMGRDVRLLFEMIRNGWRIAELRLIAFARLKGVRLARLHVRALSAVVAFLFVVLLVEIF